MTGKIELKLGTGEYVELRKKGAGVFKGNQAFTTGDLFRIDIKNYDPMFIYILGIDQTKEIFKVFPYQQNISPASIYRENTLSIPGEDNYIQITGNPGQESLYILLSKEPLDFDNLISNLSNYPGDIYQNLEALLEGNLLDPEKVNWQAGFAGFNTQFKEKSAILIQIQIDHI